MVGHQNIRHRQTSWQLKLLLIFNEDEHGILFFFPLSVEMFHTKDKFNKDNYIKNRTYIKSWSFTKQLQCREIYLVQEIPFFYSSAWF